MPRELPKNLVLQAMDPDAVRKALEGHENVLRPAYESHREYFEKIRCYRCGGKVQEFVDASRLFREGDILPNYLARCLTCGCEFEPYTKIEVSLPNLNKVGSGF